jgi:biopolymer transport protein ExbB
MTLTVFHDDASAWWNEQWQYRKKITFDTSPNGADISEGLINFTVLVRLHSGNFGFMEAKENGEDIRFVSADDQTLLKHHIENFDTIDEIGQFWVKVPQLAAGGQSFIWMYYGNAEAAVADSPADSFDIGTAAVFHFTEFEGPPQDQSANQNHPAKFSGGQGLPGVIGNAIAFNGPGDRMILPATPILTFNNGFTLSVWIRANVLQSDGHLFSRMRREAGQSLIVGIDGMSVYSAVQWTPEEAVTARATAELTPDSWQHVAVTAAPNSRLVIYLDGVESGAVDLTATLPDLKSDMAIGDSAAGEHALIAEIDDLIIANTARSPGWIKAAFSNQGSEDRLSFIGPEEVGGGGGLPVFYLATILKNITLDGWAVIGILIILAAASWIAFLSKTMFLILTRRDNKAFLAAFQGQTDLKTLEQGETRFPNSGLFMIFKAGQETLKQCLANPQMWFLGESQTGNPEAKQKKWLNSKGINAFKASLEKGFIEESQRLNSWLVIITLAISGGPFLGLLGTVWGVMNTFAAMAEAGEANIMAIAPGVASALSTTVIGLIVAIPALFSYNYLTGKIKDMTANLSIFIDQYTVKIDQLYGGSE